MSRINISGSSISITGSSIGTDGSDVTIASDGPVVIDPGTFGSGSNASVTR